MGREGYAGILRRLIPTVFEGNLGALKLLIPGLPLIEDILPVLSITTLSILPKYCVISDLYVLPGTGKLICAFVANFVVAGKVSGLIVELPKLFAVIEAVLITLGLKST